MEQHGREMDATLLDCLYNHRTICEMALCGDGAQAKARMRTQTMPLHEAEAAWRFELHNIFLTSLNRSLYTFILYSMDLSLAQCCFQNRRYLHRNADTPVFLEAASGIIDAYLSLIKTMPRRARLIEKACQYICANLSEDLTLDKVSAQVFISKCYLCQMCKPATGQSFSEYVMQQRVLRARNLLLTTEMSIAAIATACGFRTAAYFSTVFKKETALTPKIFRDTFRKEA